MGHALLLVWDSREGVDFELNCPKMDRLFIKGVISRPAYIKCYILTVSVKIRIAEKKYIFDNISTYIMYRDH